MRQADPAGGPIAGSPARRLLPFARALVVLLAVAFAASQFGELHFALDNLSNFPVHFAGAFLICTIVLAILRDLGFAFAAAAGLAFSLTLVVPWYFPAPGLQPAPEATTFKLFVSNVHIHNRGHKELLRMIAEQQPDVVGLTEVNSRWLRKLGPLRSDYPFHLEIPDEATIGLALYSKLPLSYARTLQVGDSGTPAIAATMKMPDGDIEFILVHPVSPVDENHMQRRNAQLSALGRYVRDQKRPVVLAGDLNATMWNRHYREFAEIGGLRNARAGFGVGPTWPSVGSLGVPIDHILATAPVRLHKFRVHDDFGSDHLPISAEFNLR